MKKSVFCLMAFVMMVCVAEAQTLEPSAFTVVFSTSDDGFLNVRDQPSMKGRVVTKLWIPMHGLGSGVLIESGEKWSKVSVGKEIGWVYNKYLGYQSWYNGDGENKLVAAIDNMPVYTENYVDEDEGLPLFTTVKKGTVMADQYDTWKEYYVLKTGHDYLFIKMTDVEVVKQ